MIGKSGSGKSTLINLIARLYDVEKGVVIINNKRIDDYSKGELSKQIEYIGQNEITNISKKEIIQNLNNSNFVNSNEILDFNLDEELSLGQYQYLYLCKALFSEKSVLMLDEIFTHIDSNKVQKVFEILKNQNKIIIIITHESEIMSYCDEFISLGDFGYDT